MHAPSAGTRPYAWAIAFLLVQLSPHVLWTQDVRDGETEASSPSEVAARVDVLLAELHKEAKIDPAPRAADVEWLRRAYRALAGRTPRPEEVERFVEDSRPEKRAEVIDRLVASDEWARQLAGTWRDIILSRAQDPRARNVRDTIEDWLFSRFRSNAGWDEIARDIITASGPIAERGDTGLIAAQMGQAEEIAAEVSRIFLGVQIQCAQCHDHPTAPWKRRQFHELAAYFSRLRLARTGDGPRGFEVVSIAVPAAREQAARQRFAGARFATDPLGVLERFDANDDGKLVEMELPESLQRPFRRIVRRGDQDSDGAMTRQELERFAAKDRRLPTRGEHRMPDLERPDAPGELIHPVFFGDGSSPGEYVPDGDRRGALSKAITAPTNAYFARAIVNRVWAELIGRGFVEPVDDLGPEAAAPKVFDLLSSELVRSGYDLRFLYRAIALTEAFARESRPRDSAESAHFAAVSPVPLRAEPIFAALREALATRGRAGNRGRSVPQILERRFAELFDHDPSAPIDEIAPSIPQALFLMNSPVLEGLIDARRGMLRPILARHRSDRGAIEDVWLRVLARPPREDEVAIALRHLREAPSGRGEAFEDLVWSLLNSYELRNRD